jgi:hypothetical protein
VLNGATIVIALVIAAVLIVAAYYSYKTFRCGGCEGCKNCGMKEGCRPEKKNKNK